MRTQTKLQKTKNDTKQSMREWPPASRTVNNSKLKDFVAKNYPPGSPLQTVFVDEEDILTVEAFVAKTPLWLKLSNFTGKGY